MQIVFLGDFMPSGDQAGKKMEVSRRLNNKLANFDLRVATLETAVGTYDDIDEIKSSKSEVAVWSKQEDLHKLTDLNINVVSLANNHTCDCGIDSMLNLLNKLSNMGITPIGAGHNAEEAMKPAVFEKDGESLAIIACCEDNPKALGTLHFASETTAGIYRLDDSVVVSQIKTLKESYTYVAVVVHWGVEHKWLPENYDVVIGEKLIDAGADMVIGGHPHHIQSVVTFKQRPIYYSLGNFHFPDFCLDSISNTYYPDENELKQLPVFDWMAPERRNFAMLYFWKYYARLGMMSILKLEDNSIKAKKRFVLYKKGRLSFSTIGLYHAIKLKLLSFFIGKKSSIKINYYITRINNLIEYKFLSIFIKKYGFFKYLSKHNMSK